MKKIGKRILIILCGILIFLLIGMLILFRNELHTLATLKQIDDYGMYQMTYFGDYGFDEFLKTGAKKDSDIEAFVTKRLLKGLPINLGVTQAGCTAFVTKNEQGEVIYGRNFDFPYSPSLQLYTNPKDGYASVSTVNLSYAGYSEEKLPHGVSFDSFLTLAGPFLPFDGMNEKGVAMALLAVPEASLDYDDSKVTLNTSTAIRLVLDKAANVDEAVELLKQYNIYFSGDVECHYLIADATGKSVIVEYYDGKLCVVEPDTDYQIASNFIAYQGINIGEGFTEFERYDKVKQTIIENGNQLSSEQAVDLLAKVGVKDKLQWSVVYNLTTKEGTIFAHRKQNAQNQFELSVE